VSDLKARAMRNHCPACGVKAGDECSEVGTERESNYPPRSWKQGSDWHDRRIGGGDGASVKLLPMTTDPAGGWQLRGDVRPAPPSAPGESVRVEAALQTAAPMVFSGLRVGPDQRLRVVGPGGIEHLGGSAAGVWRVDEVTIDGTAVSDVIAALEAEALSRDDRSILVVHGNFGVGARVAICATNVGDTASYFYATWELEDVQ